MANIIFDFDGTLADSLQVLMGVFYEVTGLEPVSESEIKRLRVLPVRTIAKELGLHWWHGPKYLAKGRKLMAERIDQVKVYPGIEKMVRDLHKQGHKLYIISSNSAQNVRKVLKNYKIDKYFVRVYGGSGLLGKGRILRGLIKRFKWRAEDCWYVGDELRDIEGAAEAGIRCIIVGWGFSGPDAFKIIKPYKLISKPSELLQIVQSK